MNVFTLPLFCFRTYSETWTNVLIRVLGLFSGFKILSEKFKFLKPFCPCCAIIRILIRIGKMCKTLNLIYFGSTSLHSLSSSPGFHGQPEEPRWARRWRRLAPVLGRCDGLARTLHRHPLARTVLCTPSCDRYTGQSTAPQAVTST